MYGGLVELQWIYGRFMVNSWIIVVGGFMVDWEIYDGLVDLWQISGLMFYRLVNF